MLPRREVTRTYSPAFTFQWAASSGLTSTNAAHIFGIYPQKGAIEVGSEADLVIWNPEPKSVISVNTQVQQCDSNIYEGISINGKVEFIIRNGEIH